MSNFYLHANWEQQTKESAVVDGTSCCVILECLVMSIACITWPVSLLTKWPTTIRRFPSLLSSNSLWKRKSLLQKFTRDFSVLMEVCAWVRAVFRDGWNILKMGKGGNSESSASVSSDGWNGVLPQGNFQTSRTLAEMCTKKWRLCGKIKKVM